LTRSPAGCALTTRLEGGNAAYVAEAVTRDGTPAVLKVPVPPGTDGFTPFERQLAALQLAGGDPYARLIRHDVPRQALLLERLGRPMGPWRTGLDRRPRGR
jgi:streptomycin 6-kinase